jgi:hypothetical protein
MNYLLACRLFLINHGRIFCRHREALPESLQNICYRATPYIISGQDAMCFCVRIMHVNQRLPSFLALIPAVSGITIKVDSPRYQYSVKYRQDIIDQALAAGYGGVYPDHPSIVWSGNHDERTKKSEGRQEETCNDTERKKGC